MNRKNLYRPYTEEKLGVRQRPGAWRMNANGRGANPSESWPLDFLSDTFSASRRLRILAVSDDCYPEWPVPDGRYQHPGRTGGAALVRLYGKPASLFSDNNTRLPRRAILKWANENSFDWHCIDPSKPQQNAFIERFNGSFKSSGQNIAAPHQQSPRVTKSTLAA